MLNKKHVQSLVTIIIIHDGIASAEPGAAQGEEAGMETHPTSCLRPLGKHRSTLSLPS